MWLMVKPSMDCHYYLTVNSYLMTPDNQKLPADNNFQTKEPFFMLYNRGLAAQL